ncbi:NTP transferase domain-containing protein [Candidatus Woesebacteria bacterium]|nr:NTP transferase domain-containing protein [Candidatus Woesebacteria bacterium]
MKKPLIVLLAGGVGNNFFPLATDKTLFPIMGKLMVEHVLDVLSATGIEEVVAATNPQNDSVIKRHPLVKRTALLEKPTGMHAGILAVKDYITDQSIVVVNAVDLIEKEGLSSFFAAISNQYAMILGKKVNAHQAGGYLEMCDGKVKSIVEKPEKGKEPSDIVNLIVHYFSQPKKFISLLEGAGDVDDAYEQAFSQIMQNHDVALHTYEGAWSKLKYPFHVLDVMGQLLSGVERSIAPTAHVSEHAVIEGAVVIADNAIVDEFAVVKGPAYIGNGARVGNHALVRQSVVEKAAIVGFGSEVVRSYVGPGCMLHHNYVGDSVLEKNVNPSWGTTTANYRLDKKHVMLKLPDGKTIDTQREKFGCIMAEGVFCGVNCSIMPGVTIKKNAQIYPGKVIPNVVKEDEVVK